VPSVPHGGMGDYQDPTHLAQQMAQLHQQQTDLLHQILGPGRALGNPLAKAALAGIAAMAAKQFFGGLAVTDPRGSEVVVLYCPAGARA
jgi:hypothetical protein